MMKIAKLKFVFNVFVISSSFVLFLTGVKCSFC
jgi:hypothetical protein